MSIRPRRGPAGPAPLAATLAFGLALLLLVAADRPGDARDPLETELRHWLIYVHDTTATDELSSEARRASTPILERADRYLRDGRRLLALMQLAAVRFYCAAAVYASGRPDADRKELPAFEAEWARMGTTLRPDAKPPSPADWESVRPAAVRALGEIAALQSRGYYDASLDYGRSTEALYGLYYLGTAQGQSEMAALCRRLAEPVTQKGLVLRSLADDVHALRRDLLAAYRPPASIDRHPEFIGASSLLKEATELNAAGLRHGALLRYLYAAMRVAPLRSGAPSLDSAAVAARLGEFEARCDAGGVDHSIGRLFLQYARAEMSTATPGTVPPAAIAIAADVMPRYFEALRPAPPHAPTPPPSVTVKLVRWPYT